MTLIHTSQTGYHGFSQLSDGKVWLSTLYGPLSCLWTFILMLKSWGVVVVGWWVHLDYRVSSGPFSTMNFEFDQNHGPRPGPELHNI